MLQASVGKTDKYIFCFFATRHSWLILTKTRNDLKRHKTTYNEQETTWNGLKQRETTYNTETIYRDLKRAITNKKRPETTYSN